MPIGSLASAAELGDAMSANASLLAGTVSESSKALELYDTEILAQFEAEMMRLFGVSSMAKKNAPRERGVRGIGIERGARGPP